MFEPAFMPPWTTAGVEAEHRKPAAGVLSDSPLCWRPAPVPSALPRRLSSRFVNADDLPNPTNARALAFPMRFAAVQAPAAGLL